MKRYEILHSLQRRGKINSIIQSIIEEEDIPNLIRKNTVIEDQYGNIINPNKRSSAVESITFNAPNGRKAVIQEKTAKKSVNPSLPVSNMKQISHNDGEKKMDAKNRSEGGKPMEVVKIISSAPIEVIKLSGKGHFPENPHPDESELVGGINTLVKLYQQSHQHLAEHDVDEKTKEMLKTKVVSEIENNATINETLPQDKEKKVVSEVENKTTNSPHHNKTRNLNKSRNKKINSDIDNVSSNLHSKETKIGENVTLMKERQTLKNIHGDQNNNPNPRPDASKDKSDPLKQLTVITDEVDSDHGKTPVKKPGVKEGRETKADKPPGHETTDNQRPKDVDYKPDKPETGGNKNKRKNKSKGSKTKHSHKPRHRRHHHHHHRHHHHQQHKRHEKKQSLSHASHRRTPVQSIAQIENAIEDPDLIDKVIQALGIEDILKTAHQSPHEEDDYTDLSKIKKSNDIIDEGSGDQSGSGYEEEYDDEEQEMSTVKHVKTLKHQKKLLKKHHPKHNVISD